MNDFELFLNFGAVVKIRRHYRDDLYKFVKLMLNLGFMNENITYFINSCKILGDKTLAKNLTINDKLEILEREYTDDYFWHLVDINNGSLNSICIEYQLSKGFTFGAKQDYIRYDNTIKILDIDELITACNMQEKFNLNYKETTFRKELEDKDEELANELDNFCNFYEWTIVKFPNDLWNVLDRQTNELVGYFNEENENGTFKEVIERVFYRMVSYFEDEEDIDGLIEEGSFDYVEKNINTFIKLGKQYKFFDEQNIKFWNNLLEECKEESKKLESEEE